MNTNNINQNDITQVEKFKNLVNKLKELEKQKIQLSRELEHKQKQRQILKDILHKKKLIQEKTIDSIEEYLEKGKNILKEIREIISYLKKIQDEQEQIINSIYHHPLLSKTVSSIQNSKEELLNIVYDLQKEIESFKQKRIQIEKKIAHLKDL